MVTLVILAVTAVISIIGFTAPGLIQRALLRPYAVAHGSGYAGLLTSGFVHADLSHLVFNLITLYSFGFRLEQTLGPIRFSILYFCALLVSGLGTCLKHRAEPGYASLGASGAILGVLFASIVYFPRASLYILPLPVPIPAPLFAVLYLGFSWYSARQRQGNINHDAHIFGALTGLAFVLITDPMAFRNAVHALSQGQS